MCCSLCLTWCRCCSAGFVLYLSVKFVRETTLSLCLINSPDCLRRTSDRKWIYFCISSTLTRNYHNYVWFVVSWVKLLFHLLRKSLLNLSRNSVNYKWKSCAVSHRCPLSWKEACSRRPQQNLKYHNLKKLLTWQVLTDAPGSPAAPGTEDRIKWPCPQSASSRNRARWPGAPNAPAVGTMASFRVWKATNASAAGGTVAAPAACWWWSGSAWWQRRSRWGGSKLRRWGERKGRSVMERWWRINRWVTTSRWLSGCT